MKRLWTAVLILLLLLGLTFANAVVLDRFTAQTVQLLHQAQAQAEAGAWREAAALTRTAQTRWTQCGAWLYATLRHCDIDQIRLTFCEAQAFLACEKLGEYAAANARLTNQLALLSEMERFSADNIL